MHIPDGYLSLQTSIPFFGVMTPFWSIAARKVKKAFSMRQIPFLSLCAAFSFLVMMFNIPVGPSSVHTVGAVFIAIVLGPWASCIAVSVALVVQSFVFGDGGKWVIGVNCFNMAFVMPFTGYYIYRCIAGKAQLLSRRSLTGIFLGGYFGINFAALFTAVEFGIQPMLYKTAQGVPLYGYFPLSVSVPAMMFEHLLIAGPIEAFITVSAVIYLAKLSPHLLRQYDLSSGIPGYMASEPEVTEDSKSFLTKYKYLLLALFILIITTPLGLIAGGTAWGEWSTDQIKDMIGYIPEGMDRFSRTWDALIPDYSIPGLEGSFLQTAVGYVASAGIGILLIAVFIWLVSKLFYKKRQVGSINEVSCTKSVCTEGSPNKGKSLPGIENTIPEWMLDDEDNIGVYSGGNTIFIRRTLSGLSKIFLNDLAAERFAIQKGLLQGIDARVKLITMLGFILFSGATGSVMILIILAFISVALTVFSRLELIPYIKRVWLVLPLLMFIVSIPAATSLLIKGNPLFYIYRGQNHMLYVSAEGLMSISKLALRIGVSLSYGYLLVMTTRWANIVKALRAFKAPKLITAILDMTYRFIFVLMKTASELFEARSLRTVGRVQNRKNREFVSGSIAFMFIKSNHLSEEIYDSMVSRGYHGEPVSLNEFRLSRCDWIWMLVTAVIMFAITMFIK